MPSQPQSSYQGVEGRMEGGCLKGLPVSLLPGQVLKGRVLVDDIKGRVLDDAKFLHIFLQHCSHQDVGVV